MKLEQILNSNGGQILNLKSVGTHLLAVGDVYVFVSEC